MAAPYPLENRPFQPYVPCPTEKPPQLNVHHPGLPAAFDSPLMTFICVSERGVLYTLVYYSCCVIAGNCWDDNEGRARADGRATAYLSEFQDPERPRLDIPEDGIIREKTKLWFHVPKEVPGVKFDEKFGYAFTSCFEYWRFPESMPTPWETLPKSTYFRPGPRDWSCAATGKVTCVEEAHVIPKTCISWYNRNDMRERIQPATNQNPFYEYLNTMPLNRNFHWLFDHSIIVPYPRSAGSASQKARGTLPDQRAKPDLFACVVAQPQSSSREALWEVVTAYHNLPLRPTPWVPPEYLFARFAWGIFCSARTQILHELKKQRSRVYFISYFVGGSETQAKIFKTTDKYFPWPRSNHSVKNGSEPMPGDEPKSGNERNPEVNPNSQGRTGVMMQNSAYNSDEESNSQSDSEDERHLRSFRSSDRDFSSSSSHEDSESDSEGWLGAMKRQFGPISTDSDEESDSEDEPDWLKEVKREREALALQDEADETACSRSPKRVCQREHSDAPYEGERTREASPSHSHGSAEEKGVLDLATSFGSSTGSQVSKDSRSSRDSRFTTSIKASTKSSKSGANEAIQGSKITSVLASRDVSKDSDSIHLDT
ncbi:hypothetical protein F5Y06DRAFT_270395 [Hypoxylon sp. FL0890]|nr:hypothetical protein F5Y06DRAFT_270395 [Hypoxylon sp. FL0890]